MWHEIGRRPSQTTRTRYEVYVYQWWLSTSMHGVDVLGSEKLGRGNKVTERQGGRVKGGSRKMTLTASAGSAGRELLNKERLCV